MKIQCNVCEAAEANVLCCADEAALCYACDQKLHAANKLATKHHRVPLSSSSSMPKCDICQETVGYFFCLEDRALLCRRCDVSIHTKNTLVTAHQRFLVTGVKVGLEAAEAAPSSGKAVSQSNEKKSRAESKRTTSSGQSSRGLPVQKPKLPFTGGSAAAGSISQWQLDEFLELGDYNQGYDFMDNAPSKCNQGEYRDAECSPVLHPADAEVEGEDCMDSFWAVPEIPSPPTASGLYWPKSAVHNPCDSAVFVPDILPVSFNPYCDNSKRRRRF